MSSVKWNGNWYRVQILTESKGLIAENQRGRSGQPVRAARDVREKTMGRMVEDEEKLPNDDF
jgi:hypothetical protein